MQIIITKRKYDYSIHVGTKPDLKQQGNSPEEALWKLLTTFNDYFNINLITTELRDNTGC